MLQHSPSSRPDAGQPPPSVAQEAPTLRWTVRPPRVGRRLIAPVAAVGATLVIGVFLLHNVAMAVGCSLAILGAVAEGLWPVHHRVGPDGALTRCGWQVREMPWSRVRSVWSGPDGVYLCPFERPSRWLQTRGVVLRYADGVGPDLLEHVRRYWKEGNAA